MEESRKPFIISILKGQVISLLIAGTGFFASLLSSLGVSMPIFLNMINYTLLIPYIFARTHLPSLSSRLLSTYFAEESLGAHAPLNGTESYAKKFFSLNVPWWLYGIVAIIDLEANVIIVSAYRYTSVTSVMLLDCFSIPCVMLLSYIFLNAKYSYQHLGGVVICLLGMGCIVLSDYYSESNGCDSCADPVYGDILCLVSI